MIGKHLWLISAPLNITIIRHVVLRQTCVAEIVRDMCSWSLFINARACTNPECMPDLQSCLFNGIFPKDECIWFSMLEVSETIFATIAPSLYNTVPATARWQQRQPPNC